MRIVRALYRLFLLIILTAVLTIVWIVRIPFLSQGKRPHWRGTMVGLWARNVLRIIGANVKVAGAPPTAPFCLVSNHLSYLDIVLFQSQIPCVFVSKSEVAGWPIIGWLARAVGTLFIDRNSRKDVVRVNVEIKRVLDSGEGIIIFPEGTSSEGKRVLPFKTAILGAVAATGQPVTYASISYRTPEHEPPAKSVLCWWGDMTFGDHFFNMLKLPCFEAIIVFGEDALQSSDRKEMARLLKEKVSQNFIPVA